MVLYMFVFVVAQEFVVYMMRRALQRCQLLTEHNTHTVLNIRVSMMQV